MKFSIKRAVTSLFSKKENIMPCVYAPPPVPEYNTAAESQDTQRTSGSEAVPGANSEEEAFSPEENIISLVYGPPRG